MADWITVRQAAQLIGYKEEYIRELIRQGRINAQKFATVWQVNKTSVMNYANQMGKKGKKRGPKTS